MAAFLIISIYVCKFIHIDILQYFSLIELKSQPSSLNMSTTCLICIYKIFLQIFEQGWVALKNANGIK